MVSGKCKSHCPKGRDPYGVNQPGPSITYKMQHTIGHFDESAGTNYATAAVIIQIIFWKQCIWTGRTCVHVCFYDLPVTRIKYEGSMIWFQRLSSASRLTSPCSCRTLCLDWDKLRTSWRKSRSVYQHRSTSQTASEPGRKSFLTRISLWSHTREASQTAGRWNCIWPPASSSTSPGSRCWALVWCVQSSWACYSC